MKTFYSACYDTKVKSYGQLIPSRTVEEAIRGFKGAVQKPDTDFNTYAEDYSLWLVGQFDLETGEFEKQKPTMLAQALEFKSK